MVVASDSLGRVLLVDVASLTVIRMWKSYRDAQFGWVICTTVGTAKDSQNHEHLSQAHAGKRRRADSEQQEMPEVIEDTDDTVEADAPNTASLHLVLYAPRRQALELWQMRHGPRVAITHVENECKLLQQSRAFGLDPEVAEHAESAVESPSSASQCLVLDTQTGQTINVLAAFQKQMRQTA